MDNPMVTLHLEVNDAGGWRRVMSFDAPRKADVLDLAELLLGFGDNPKLRARVIARGSTAPLMTWTQAAGWQSWRRQEDMTP